MKCTTTREQLLNPLTHLERTTGKNLSLPVLACVLLEVKKNILSLTATNLEIGVRYSVNVADAVEGRVAVPASTFSQVVASLPSGCALTLEGDAGCLMLKSAGGNTRITLHKVEEFPALPQVEDGVTYTLPTNALKDALTRVAYCASSSSIKPELASVFVSIDGSTLVTCATDAFRLAESSVPLPQSTTGAPFLLPARSVQDVVRALEQVGEKVEILLNEHQLSITAPGLYMTTRLTTGTFPDYRAIIPKDFVTEATLLRADLERVLKKASAFSDQFNQTTLTIDPNTKTFTVHTENSVVGETTDTVPATLVGEEIEIRFNHRYLLEALHSIVADSIMIRFSGTSHPALVQPMGDAGFQYLVMPMNR
jgi:DNA polymerase-3 subunit beta